MLNSSDINQLKLKPSGSKRLVLAYLSIGEAEDYRYYWKSEWNTNPPDWLCNENPNWLGNYKVKYWYAEWQNIIFGNNESYVYKIINSGFDGIYLDIIDAFEYFKDLY
ncbi:MAG: endo alpha-1,4 polygalactosaminidase [Candidatus Helarchaeota archaeon]